MARDDEKQVNMFDNKEKHKPKKATNMDETPAEETGLVFTRTVEDVMNSSMLPYSECVILDRALPRVEDGLKPVQRRILYAMLEAGLTPDKPYKKCAATVGDVLGKYHPHGDTSVYDAMVRMAQDFTINTPLIDGHGNFGSVDGDPAAAYRYTEARLSKLAVELMQDIDKDTVNFSLSFDDKRKEPDYLPGRFPNLLVNGASGIAVGLATNIPPHNLGEVIDATVAYIDDENIDLGGLLKYIKGPDFPTGAMVLKNQNMIDAYATGRGKVQVRAVWNLEELPNGKTNIIITELPYQVNKAEFLTHIVDVKEKYKGCLNAITEIQDESDMSGMRAVITVRKDGDVQGIISELLKRTEMQASFSYNVVAIADGKPKLLPLLDIIRYYVNFQVDVIVRRTKFNLEKAEARAHILEGLLIAIQNIDEVIKIIKGSKSVQEAKIELMSRFGLTEVQAVAILDMKLSRLTNLETYKIEEELAELNKKIKKYKHILSARKYQLEVVRAELLSIKERYPLPRKTQVVRSFDEYVATPIEKAIENEECVLYVTTDGLRVKNVPFKSIKDGDNSFNATKNANLLFRDSAHAYSNDTILAFTNLGNVYKFTARFIEQCKLNGKGTQLSQICKCEAHEQIVNIFNLAETNVANDLFFFTRDGFIRKCPFSEFDIAKSSASAIKLKLGDEVIRVQDNLYMPSAVCVTKNGMVLNCELGSVPSQKRGASGVIGIQLSQGDEVVFAGQVMSSDKLIVLTDNNHIKRVNMTEIPMSARNRKGLQICVAKEKVDFAIAPVVSGEFVAVFKSGAVEVVDVSKIDVLPRNKTGKPMQNVKNNDKLLLATIYNI